MTSVLACMKQPSPEEATAYLCRRLQRHDSV